MSAFIYRRAVAGLFTVWLALAMTKPSGAQQPVGKAATPGTVITFDEALKLALSQSTGVK
jgi:hypothetical protein